MGLLEYFEYSRSGSVGNQVKSNENTRISGLFGNNNCWHFIETFRNIVISGSLLKSATGQLADVKATRSRCIARW